MSCEEVLMASEPKADGIRVYDPRGRVETEPTPIAERVRALSGLRLGVLDNTKWNAGKLLRVARDVSHLDVEADVFRRGGVQGVVLARAQLV